MPCAHCSCTAAQHAPPCAGVRAQRCSAVEVNTTQEHRMLGRSCMHAGVLLCRREGQSALPLEVVGTSAVHWQRRAHPARQLYRRCSAHACNSAIDVTIEEPLAGYMLSGLCPLRRRRRRRHGGQSRCARWPHQPASEVLPPSLHMLASRHMKCRTPLCFCKRLGRWPRPVRPLASSFWRFCRRFAAPRKLHKRRSPNASAAAACRRHRRTLPPLLEAL